MAKGGGMMEIVMLVALIGGFVLLWPHISGMLNVSAGAVDTDTSGGGKANASDKGGTVTAGNGGGGQYGFPDTEEMIRQITAKAKGGQRNSGGSGTNISVQGKGATACANGKCVSSYGEMQVDFSNVI